MTNTGYPKRLFDAGDIGVRGAGDVAQHQVVHLGQAGLSEDRLHELLVHAHGAAEHAGAGVRQAGHLEQTLDGAVLAERAVQHREDEVERDEPPIGAQLQAGPARVDEQPGGLARDRSEPVTQRRLSVGRHHPGAVARYAHGRDREPVRIEGAENEARRGE